MQSRERVIKKMIELQMVQRGSFTLKSGQTSEFYLDLRRMLADPSLMREMAQLIATHPLASRGKLIAGVPYAALSLATLVSQNLDKPSVLVRKERKLHGTAKWVEGVYQTGDRVLLIEDVITSGESICAGIQALKSEGLEVAAVLSVVDRGQGGLNRIRDLGISADALFTVDELLEYRSDVCASSIQTETGVNSVVQSELCAALDTSTFGEALEKVRLLWEQRKIKAIKTHADLYSDFDLRRARDLRDYCDEKGIFILEDRKLADIGSVMIRQLHEGPQKISSWAHAVTVHAAPGRAALKALADSCSSTRTQLILISDLSTEGQLLNPDYQAQALSIATDLFPVVSGIVSQHRRPSHPGQKLWMPGLALESDRLGDGSGQKYRTLAEVPGSLRPDFAIMGRSLIAKIRPDSLGS